MDLQMITANVNQLDNFQVINFRRTFLQMPTRNVNTYTFYHRCVTWCGDHVISCAWTIADSRDNWIATARCGSVARDPTNKRNTHNTHVYAVPYVYLHRIITLNGANMMYILRYTIYRVSSFGHRPFYFGTKMVPLIGGRELTSGTCRHATHLVTFNI